MAEGVAVSVRGQYYRRKGLQTLPEPAYVKDIVQPLERYSERNNPLSRGYVPPGGWDESLLKTLVPAIGEQGPLPRNEPGYGPIEFAQRIAGFHAAMATNCHTGNWTRPPLTDDLGCFYDWDGRWGPSSAGLPWQPEKMPVGDPAAMTEVVKDTALFLGASLVGITRIDPRWIFKPGWHRYGHYEIDLDAKLPEGLRYAVVMAIETNYDFVRHAPTAKASAAAGLGYSKMAMLSPSLAKFIAMLG